MITATLIYLSMGCLIWVFIDGCGIIENTYAARNAASRGAMVLASLYAIVGWPLLVFVWVRGMWRTRGVR